MTRLTTVALLTTLACGRVDPAAQAAGQWKSAAAEDMGNGSFSSREFAITPTRWSIVFTIYGDKELKFPLLAFEGEGPWTVGAESTKVSGAHEATFEFQTKKLTLLSSDPAVATGFGVGACGLTFGTPKDISETGCSFFTSVKAYPREFDLVKVDGETLYLGVRAADGNMGSEDRRPTALGAPLKRK